MGDKKEAWSKWVEKTTYARKAYVESCDACVKRAYEAIFAPYVPFQHTKFTLIEEIDAEEHKELDRLRKIYRDFILGWWEKLSPDFWTEDSVVPNEVEALLAERNILEGNIAEVKNGNV